MHLLVPTLSITQSALNFIHIAVATLVALKRGRKLSVKILQQASITDDMNETAKLLRYGNMCGYLRERGDGDEQSMVDFVLITGVFPLDQTA